MKDHFARISKFFSVQVFGTAIDYVVALGLFTLLAMSGPVATTVGFVIGSAVNYFGHSVFTFNEVGREGASFLGFGKYLGAVATSLVIRLIVIAGLDMAGLFPFWLTLAIAFGASFISSYVISSIWVFRKKEP